MTLVHKKINVFITQMVQLSIRPQHVFVVSTKLIHSFVENPIHILKMFGRTKKFRKIFDQKDLSNEIRICTIIYLPLFPPYFMFLNLFECMEHLLIFLGKLLYFLKLYNCKAEGEVVGGSEQ